jgi:hypothetical protein
MRYSKKFKFQFPANTLIIFDEAHRYPSRIFSQAFQKTCPKYILSLTATPNRTDGLTKVLYWFSGDIIYKQLSKPNKQVIVKVFNYESTDKLFAEKKMWVKGKTAPSNTKMINNLVQIKSRNEHLLNILNRLRKNPERKVLVLSGRREHLKELKDSLDTCIQKDIDDGNIMKDECRSYYYVGGMSKWDLQEAAQKGDILFGTYDMAQEGLDIDKLNISKSIDIDKDKEKFDNTKNVNTQIPSNKDKNLNFNININNPPDLGPRQASIDLKKNTSLLAPDFHVDSKITKKLDYKLPVKFKGVDYFKLCDVIKKHLDTGRRELITNKIDKTLAHCELAYYYLINIEK